MSLKWFFLYFFVIIIFASDVYSESYSRVTVRFMSEYDTYTTVPVIHMPDTILRGTEQNITVSVYAENIYNPFIEFYYTNATVTGNMTTPLNTTELLIFDNGTNGNYTYKYKFNVSGTYSLVATAYGYDNTSGTATKTIYVYVPAPGGGGGGGGLIPYNQSIINYLHLTNISKKATICGYVSMFLDEHIELQAGNNMSLIVYTARDIIILRDKINNETGIYLEYVDMKKYLDYPKMECPGLFQVPFMISNLLLLIIILAVLIISVTSYIVIKKYKNKKSKKELGKSKKNRDN